MPTRRLGGAGTCDISALIHTCKPSLLNAQEALGQGDITRQTNRGVLRVIDSVVRDRDNRTHLRPAIDHSSLMMPYKRSDQ